MAEWIGIVNSTREKFVKGAADQTMRKRLAFAMLQKRGLVDKGNHGDQFQWQLLYDLPVTQQRGDNVGRTFVAHDAHRTMILDWRGHEATDLLTEKQALMNKGDEALINLYAKKTTYLMSSVKNYMNSSLYADGNASGNENQYHGLESFFAVTTPAAGDLIATPNDSYAGKNTNLADQGGTWSSDLGSGNFPNATLANDWPYGTGSSKYDYNAPICGNWSSTGWATGGTSFKENAVTCIRQMIDWLVTLRGEDGMPNLLLMHSKLLTDFKNAQESKQRVIVPHKESEDLGFPEVVNFDGVGLQSEYNVPVNTGYFLNMRGEGEYANMKMRVLGDDLFKSRGPDWDNNLASYIYSISGFGNYQFNPRFFGKIKNYA